ncbi:MAG: hypothetical protein ACLFU8_05660 [Anaerolineales bacterium]
MVVDTSTLMQIALELVGYDGIPADSAIYVPGEGIERLLFGLDIGAGELLMARQLGYDAVIAHHPVGVTYRAWQVFERHVDLLVDAGVPVEAARAAVAPKLETLRLGGIVRNYEQVPQAARLLGMPFLNIHAPLDELGRRKMQAAVDARLVADAEPSLGDVARTLSELPAARRALTEVQVLLGDADAPAGRVVVAHGALTNGGYEVARAYFDHGIDTVVYIHITAGDLVRLQAHDGGQLLVTGHLTGDAVGIAPYVEALRRRGLTVDVLSDVLADAPPRG